MQSSSTILRGKTKFEIIKSVLRKRLLNISIIVVGLTGVTFIIITVMIKPENATFIFLSALFSTITCVLSIFKDGFKFITWIWIFNAVAWIFNFYIYK